MPCPCPLQKRIFSGAADIRSSLPDDAKRYDAVEAGLQAVNTEVCCANCRCTPRSAVPLAVASHLCVPIQAMMDLRVVKACQRAGLLDTLQTLTAQVEKCERALVHFLDLKKAKFPRFFFVSNASLLDMLANGRDPPKVLPHLADCFEALASLNLEMASVHRALVDAALASGAPAGLVAGCSFFAT